MGVNLRSLLLTFLEGIWQASRYVLAAGVTGLAVVTVPILVALILAVVGGISVGLISLMALSGAVTGAADPPILGLLIAVALPVAFITAVIVLFAAIAVGVSLFVGLLVLPVSLIIEVVLEVDRVRSVPQRLASYIVGAVPVASTTSVLWVFLGHRFDVLTTVIVGILVFSLVLLSVSCFGLTLTMAETLRRALGKGIIWLREQVRSER